MINMTRLLRSFLAYVNAKMDPVGFSRKAGVKVGENCKIIANPITAFGSEPWLITIGDHVEITAGVRFVTHDGGIWVIRDQHPDADVFGPISVGNNVFIGLGAIILPGTTIGNDCVIGAGSVVKGNVPDGCVYAGVPAKLVKTTEAYSKALLERAVPTHKMSLAMKRAYIEKNGFAPRDTNRP